ncbi:polysaccharide biosynthesis tyrosine autokinase [bacterium]|nr:polysaccharide biosynthesis tyrosine autokinase [bacterium]
MYNEQEESRIENIHLLDYWKVVRKHLNLGLTVFSVIVAGTLLYLFTATPIYEAVSRILITEDLSRTVMGAELAQSIFSDQLRFETELQILKGDPVYDGVIQSLRLCPEGKGSPEYERTLNGLKGRVVCSRLRNTRLLEVKAASASPDTAALLANTLVSVYMNAYRTRQLESSRNTASWLNQQLLDLEYKVKQSQQELLDYISAERITFVSDGTGLESELKTDLFKAPDETLLDDIHARLIQAKLERDDILQRYKGKHPKVQQADAKVASLEREYAQEKVRLESERNLLTNKIIEARRKAVRHDILKRQVDTNKELYNLFIKKMQEVDLSQGLGEGDIKVVESAVPPMLPDKPKKRLVLLIGVLLGLSLGVGSTFLVEYLDRSLKSKEEIEALTGLPVLSSISLQSVADKGAFDYRTYFGDRDYRKEHELFRVLRANIKFSDLKQKSRILLVTSSCPGEGKTTVSSRLALNLAAAGERVLLVDADLRKPRVHKIFGLENKRGLTNMMVEEMPDFSFIHPELTAGLDVLNCGPLPAQPAELIENSRFGALIKELAGRYDRIIIDSPPVATVIDAALIATFCDSVLLVIDPRTTDRQVLRQAQTQLEKAGIRILGLVLNKIAHEEEGYYYYSYYYYEDSATGDRKKRTHRKKRSAEKQKEEVTV